MRYLLVISLMMVSLAVISETIPLRYSIDITQGEKFFPPDKIELVNEHEPKPTEIGKVWKVKAGLLMELQFTLPDMEIDNCHLEIREYGMPRNNVIETVILGMNGERIQPLNTVAPQQSQTNYYDLGKKLSKGSNILKIAGLKHDLGIQNITIACKLLLKTDKYLSDQSISLVAPNPSQHIELGKKFPITWKTNNLPEHALINLEYWDTDENWQTIIKGVSHNRGYYDWEKIPFDANPTVKVRIKYEAHQPKSGSICDVPVTNKTPMRFVYVPAGCFNIGSSDNGVRTCVDGFWIGETEVTNKQYETKAYQHKSGDNFSENNQPVVKVSLLEARKFATDISNKNTFSLPTEAQWEYAARAGQTTEYLPADKKVCSYANVADIELAQNDQINHKNEDCEDEYIYTAPVGKFKPNAFGLYDMIGNVAEWTCSSLSLGKINSYADANKCYTNRFAPLFRGGSWKSYGKQLSFNKRFYSVTDSQQVGFRLISKDVKLCK